MIWYLIKFVGRVLVVFSCLLLLSVLGLLFDLEMLQGLGDRSLWCDWGRYIAGKRDSPL
jgi:hypothetical protein